MDLNPYRKPNGSRLDSETLKTLPLTGSVLVPLQPQLLGFSPALKGQETESNRYGIFGQQPQLNPSISQFDDKENMPEVSGSGISCRKLLLFTIKIERKKSAVAMVKALHLSG